MEEVSKGLGRRRSGFDDRIGVTGLGFCWLAFCAGVALGFDFFGDGV